MRSLSFNLCLLTILTQSLVDLATKTIAACQSFATNLYITSPLLPLYSVSPTKMRTPSHMRPPPCLGHRKQLGAPKKRHPPDHNDRTCFFYDTISIRGWPSRGGLIVLRPITAVEYEFLGLDVINPSLYRDSNQDAEDQFCQRLLSLGAKWYDSLSRYRFIYAVEKNEEREVTALETGEECVCMPSAMECQWISVGYPSGEAGGLWVAEYEINMYGMPCRQEVASDVVVSIIALGQITV